MTCYNVFFSVFICALGLFLLPTKEMLDVYSLILSGVVLWFSYRFNRHYVKLEASSNTPSMDSPTEIVTSNPQRFMVNAMVQIAMAFSYNSFRLDLPLAVAGPVRSFVQQFRTATYLCMLQPIIWRILGFPMQHLHKISVMSVLLIAMELNLTLLVQSKAIVRWMKRTYRDAKTIMKIRGIQLFLEIQWHRLYVPTVLRVFWITRVTYQITYFLVNKWWITQGDPSQNTMTVDSILEIMQTVLVTGCETITALMGMTAVISVIAHYLGILISAFVNSDTTEDNNMGTVSAILFFILALQTGLTGLEPDKRFVRLGRNFCLLSAAILQLSHSIVNPILMNVSASHNPSPWKHGRPLAMCAFLIVFPCCFLHYLWSHHEISTWLLAVSSFNIEVIVKVIISLLLYSLFMIDAHRDVFWERLDDYVYNIKSTGNTLEFLFGIFVFCNGAWIMVFESGGTIRACMMCIHAYFNIFVQAKNGWKVFMKRRTAVNKVNSLPMATAVQLENHNDVCSICYQDLLSASITRCNHFFHGVCLRKWLYVQDRCPLCHELIYTPEPDPNVENRNNAEFEQNMNDANIENMANAVQHRDGFQPAGINNQNPLAQNNGFGAHAQD